MTIETINKLAKHICRLLKVHDITFPIARTPKGNLGITFNEDNDEFTLMLDSVPLSTASMLNDENNIELKRMVEKYWFSPELIYKSTSVGSTTASFLASGTVDEILDTEPVKELLSHAKDASESVSTPTAPKKHGNTKTKKAS